MANPHKGEVEFEAGDEKLVLRLSANAICEIEDALQMSITEVGEGMGDPKRLRAATTRTIFCIGLVDHYRETRPEIDAAKAQMFFSRLRMVDAMSIVTKAFTASFGGDEVSAGKSNPPKPGEPASGTGPDSATTGSASG